MKNLNKGWQYFTLNNLNLFVKSDLNKAFDSFWSNVINNLDNNQIVGLLIKVKDNDGTMLPAVSRLNLFLNLIINAYNITIVIIILPHIMQLFLNHMKRFTVTV
jgi:hypothetical protein